MMTRRQDNGNSTAWKNLVNGLIIAVLTFSAGAIGAYVGVVRGLADLRVSINNESLARQLGDERLEQRITLHERAK